MRKLKLLFCSMLLLATMSSEALNIHPISEIEHYNQRNPASALFCKQDSDCEAEECFFIDVKTDSKICLKEFDRRVNKSKLNSIELEELKKAQSLLSTPSGYL